MKVRNINKERLTEFREDRNELEFPDLLLGQPNN
jgi:hypothetical protein